jgi:hypothetical protein
MDKKTMTKPVISIKTKDSLSNQVDATIKVLQEEILRLRDGASKVREKALGILTEELEQWLLTNQATSNTLLEAVTAVTRLQENVSTMTSLIPKQDHLTEKYNKQTSLQPVLHRIFQHLTAVGVAVEGLEESLTYLKSYQ